MRLLAADIKAVPLKREHIPELPAATQDNLLNSHGYAVLRGHRVIAALGATEIWPGRGWAWVYAYDLRPREWVLLSRKITEALPAFGFGRIEALVKKGFPEGERFAERCGFAKETLCRKIMPDGSDGWLYARIDDGSAP